jgi:hypothetical protein
LRFVEGDRLAVAHAHIEFGKSFLCGVMRTLWLLGRDPSARIIVCSSAHGQAERVAGTVKSYIEQSTELREVFPKLRPAFPRNSPAASPRHDPPLGSCITLPP